MHCSLLCIHSKFSVLLSFIFCLNNMLIFFIFSVRSGMFCVLLAAENFSPTYVPPASKQLASTAGLQLNKWPMLSRCHAQTQILDVTSTSHTTRKRSMRRHACMLHASAQKMVAHLKDQRHRFSITLSPSTNGLRQTSIMSRRRGFPSHGTVGLCSWSGRTSPCSSW